MVTVKQYEGNILIVVADPVIFLWREEWETKVSWTQTNSCYRKIYDLVGVMSPCEICSVFIVFSVIHYLVEMSWAGRTFGLYGM
jgi:hypothetical protein